MSIREVIQMLEQIFKMLIDLFTQYFGDKNAEGEEAEPTE